VAALVSVGVATLADPGGATPVVLGSGVAEDVLPPLVEDPNEYIVGFDALPEGVEVGATYEGAEVLRVVGPELAWALFDVADAPAFLATVSDDPNVRYVERNRLVRFDPGPLVPSPAVAQGGSPEGQSAEGPGDSAGGGLAYEPEDDFYGLQYGPQLIGADEAWKLTTGSTSDTGVCVVDTGVRDTHEDLRSVSPSHWRDYRNGRADPYDDNGHGTHVAGIATARIDNGKGIAGMAQVTLYAAKVLRADGSFLVADYASIGEAIRWCADRSRDHLVINLSLGGAAFTQDTPQAIGDQIDYAYDTRGRLLVAAAGNDGPCSACITWPAKHENVIAVTNIDWNMEFYSGSSRDSRYAELAAPGVSILSTDRGSDSHYTYGTGTSMAAPHVAGALALAWSHPDNHDLSNAELWARARATAKDLGPAGHDGYYGHGMVDAKCLVERNPYPIRNPAAEAGPGTGEVTLTWTKPIRTCGTIRGYRIYRAPAGGSYTQIAEVLAPIRTYTDSGLSNGTTYNYRVRARNDYGTSYYTKSLSVTTFAKPSAPRSPNAAPGDAVGRIEVTWSAPSSDGGSPITEYRVYRSASPSGTETKVGTVSGSARSWMDTGRLAGLTQYYRIRAINVLGGSPYSAQVCSKPNPSLSGVC
jgi:hypothetical protein